MRTSLEHPAGWQQFRAAFPTARMLWSVPAGDGHLRAFSVAGRVILIHDYAGDHGWTAYIDPFTRLTASETFTAIAKHTAEHPSDAL